ncbi:hypothetical protein [Clostridium sp.]|uniref:hypothetical protein n=1 Tax=Clostridium sp. TaxID=1506 RepID=UPI0028462A9D|nr:hypothetical protein [Clostridium sp.]MDR3595515.1 hypothetical protein [Clostridium sp.]
MHRYRDVIILLNGIFKGNFNSDEVKLSVSNNEFVMNIFDTLRVYIFFDILNNDSEEISYI